MAGEEEKTLVEGDILTFDNNRVCLFHPNEKEPYNSMEVPPGFNIQSGIKLICSGKDLEAQPCYRFIKK